MDGSGSLETRSMNNRAIAFRLRQTTGGLSRVVGYEKWYPGELHKEGYWVAKSRWLYSKDRLYWNPDSIYHDAKDQAIGLNDKLGNPIFEGDILKPTRHKELAVVEWSNLGSWMRHPYPNKKGVSFFMTDGQDGIDPDMKLHYQEVVGNVYETPEFMVEYKP